MSKLREIICESIAEEADTIAEEFQNEIMNGNETIHMLGEVHVLTPYLECNISCDDIYMPCHIYGHWLADYFIPATVPNNL